MRFHGSYRPRDVEFLLTPVKIELIEDLALKEALIQSGQRHYSEMLSPERAPSDHYLALFHRAHADNRERLARDCLRLTRLLVERHLEDLTVVSLARAGTPIGAIISHLTEQLYGFRPAHYSVSIIRDRGIDANALDEILSRSHCDTGIAFVDGWTGKGVISRELATAVAKYNAAKGVMIDPGLNVLTDLAGSAARAASGEDYLISSSILNSTISGLVSRSILNEAIGTKDFHGCVFFQEFASQDLSRWFVDDIVAAATEIHRHVGFPPLNAPPRKQLESVSRGYIQAAMYLYGIDDENLIKPGIGEATRVLLRRNPERVIVRDRYSERVAHLMTLAAEKSVLVEVDPALPYHAASIIRSARDA